MHILWKRKQATGNEVIHEVTPETGWSPNTVRTLLTRLAEKGVLEAEKVQLQKKEHVQMLYTPLLSREECVKVHGQSFLNRVFEGDAAELLVHFVKDGNLSSKQIAKLKTLLNTIPAQTEGGSDD